MAINFNSSSDVTELEEAKRALLRSETSISQARYTIRHLENEIKQLHQELQLSRMEHLRAEPNALKTTSEIKYDFIEDNEKIKLAEENKLLKAQLESALKRNEDLQRLVIDIEQLQIENTKLRKLNNL